MAVTSPCFRNVGVAATIALLAGCAKAPEPASLAAAFEPETFFLGRTEATGVFEARDGRATRRFRQTIDGRLDGDALVIDQTFTYDDGETEDRQWRLIETGPGRYSATSAAAAAPGTGEIVDGVFIWRWTYENTSLAAWDDLTVTQRMVLHDERRALNTAIITKFGVRLATISEIFVKP